MRPIRSKTVLIRRKYLDSWFISRGGMNLYRGCTHNCIYCDGRSESYRVEGDFARDAVYKENAVDLLIRELDPRRRRKIFNPGYLFIGGGVSDSWQPAEEKLRLTRTVLELFKVFPNPLLLLTKSSLILRDFDLLTVLNDECRVIVAVSLSTVDEKLASILEPGASPPSERLEVVRRAKAAGFGTGVMLLPVVPGITDSPEQLDHVYSAVKNAGADFIAAGPMTLKKGRQWNYFMAAAKVHFPESVAGYQEVYGTVPDQWGNPSGAYYKYFGPLIHQISLRYGLPRRIPSRLFPDNLSKTERVMLMLDQMDGLLRDRGINSSFGRASRSIRKMENLQHAIEPGSDAEGTINEILDTGTSLVYERLLVGKNINETGLD